ncbi:hypothetical protein KYC5002_00640 [Archangium violaceum]|uniref:hypothetical protein n=1 Tax=Archangium violaceum TaxID=83451 RepID=UPI002B28F1FF|nr:hypothetical protein KYC5002_00640 [Archangium gephyra]
MARINARMARNVEHAASAARRSGPLGATLLSGAGAGRHGAGGRLRYVLAHGVKEGLVERSDEWPGLTCLAQLLGPARRLFQWFNWTKRRSKRGREDTAEGEGRFAEEIAEPEVRADVFVSLNGRPRQRLVDPGVRGTTSTVGYCPSARSIPLER